MLNEEQNTTPDAKSALVAALHQDEVQIDLLQGDAETASITPEQALETSSLITEFVVDVPRTEHADLSNWLATRFRHYASLWENDESLLRDANNIVETAERQQALRQSLEAAQNRGKSANNWFAGQLSDAATRHGTLNVSEYGHLIDTALKKTNQQMQDIILTKNGIVSQAHNLDGFIAEAHHVSTFNINAAAAGSGARAELVIRPGERFPKNSVDVQIKDANGKVVRRYQAKYGKDAGATEDLFKKGSYQGQRSLVPEDHAGEMKRKATETIEYDGVQSKRFSKEEAKRQQNEAQRSGKIDGFDWKTADAGAVSKRIGKEAAIAAGLGVAFQGGRIIARRCWNALTGKPNATVGEDVKEFVTRSIETGASTALTVAVSGALMVATKRGLLGELLKNSPAGRIAMIGSVAVDNLRVLSRLARGQIGKQEAVDQMAHTTLTSAAGLVAAGEGMAFGAAWGSVFGPAGTFAGGLAGGIVGGIAGSAIADKVYSAGKALLKTGVETVGRVVSTGWEGVKSAGRAFVSLFW